MLRYSRSPLIKRSNSYLFFLPNCEAKENDGKLPEVLHGRGGEG